MRFNMKTRHLAIVIVMLHVTSGETLTSAETNNVAVVVDQLRKPCPEKLDEAISCFESKQKKIWTYMGEVERGSDKSILLGAAQFLGEIRARRIPNYNYISRSLPDELPEIMVRSKEPSVNPETIKDPEIKKDLDKAWAKWRQDQLTFELQSLLKRLDDQLTPILLRGSAGFAIAGTDTAEVLEEIGSAARLTEDERKKLP